MALCNGYGGALMALCNGCGGALMALCNGYGGALMALCDVGMEEPSWHYVMDMEEP